jgi:multiple sugar transport system substrate-binding protein
MRRLSMLAAAIAVVAAGCGGASGGGTSTTTFDPARVTGTVVLSGWQASPEEGAALQQTLAGFAAKYPGIRVDYQPVQGDYPTVMVAKLSAHQPPDLFYVDSSVAPDWIKQGALESLDGYARDQHFDTGKFYPGYLGAFKAAGSGSVYGFPKDGNTLALAYNDKLLTSAGVQPPATWDELISAGQALRRAGVKTPYCLADDLARVGAFIYQNGGGIIDAKARKDLIDSPATRQAVGWYLDLYRQGLASSDKDLGVSWCGEALGQQKAAMIFEGGWLDSFMKGSFPSVKYTWAPMPKGKQQATLGFTVSYSIGRESAHKQAAWVLLSYLTGQDGMRQWTQGGVANPSRTDVPAAPGKEVLVQGAKYAHPWSFIAGFSKVLDAFNNAFTGAEQGNGSADTVISRTKTVIDQQLSGP